MKKTMNRKGFTLIEMMIVIAIIAVLVAVIVPTVTGSTDKAAAATNAANLRGVEGEIVSMMLLEPDAFGDQAGKQGVVDTRRDELLKEAADLEETDKKLQQLRKQKEESQQEIADLQAQINEWNDKISEANKHTNCTSEPTTKWRCIIYPYDETTCKEEKANGNKLHAACGEVETTEYHCDEGMSEAECRAVQLLVKGVDVAIAGLNQSIAAANGLIDEIDGQITARLEELKSENSANQAANNAAEASIYNFQAVDGYITLDNGTVISAPASKAVNKDAVTIDKDVQMVVYVDTMTYQAYAYYPSGTTEYSSSDFAAVAGNED